MGEKYSGIVVGNRISAEDMENALDTRQALLPVGTILMHTGRDWVNNSTLPGWYVCDGNNGTPNLVNRFVRGGAQSTLNGQAVNDAARLLGSDTVSVGINNLPAHTHAIGSHTHTVTGTVVSAGHSHTVHDPGHAHETRWATGWNRGGGTHGGPEYAGREETYGSATGIWLSGGEHDHTFSGGSAAEPTTGDTGNNTTSAAALTTVPAYYALIYIIRLQ